MNAWIDTGIITKWYLPEADSAAALRLRTRVSPPAYLADIHRLELASAWLQKVFRREISLPEVREALDWLERDRRQGIWIAPDGELSDVFERAETLALEHSARLGVRALDILHVAGAVEAGASVFVTGDRRQKRLAEASGLDVIHYRSSPA